MNKHDDGGHAFPHSRLGSDANGMTLRDYFAAQAMQSLIADSGWRTDHMEATARLSYQMADAMLKERSK